MFKKLSLPSLIVLSIFLFSSCEYEAFEGDIPVSENPTDNPNDPNDPTGGDGIYWPLAVGNTWEFTNSESSNFQMSYDEGPMNIVGTIDADGETYYQLPSFISIDAGTSGIPEGTDATIVDNGGIRYSNGNYTQLIDFVMEMQMGEFVTTNHSVATPMIIFKEDVEAGDTWTETTEMTMNIEVMGQTQTSTQNLSYHFTVDEKDVSATVNGQSFENVIKMTLVDQSGQMMTHFWMAKDVGPIFLEFIELNNADDASDDEWARREIVSYDLN